MEWQNTISMLSDRTLQLILDQHPEHPTRQRKEGTPLDFLMEPDYLESLWNRFTLEERTVMSYFLFKIRDQVLTYRQMEKGIPGLPAARFRYALTLLRRKGLVYTVRRQWGELGYIIPEELQQVWRGVLLKQIPSSGYQVEPSTSLSPFTYPYPILVRDLFLLLKHIHDAPISLTRKGTVRRRDVKRVTADCRISAEPFLHLGISFDPNNAYNLSEAILFDFLIHLGLLVEGDEKWWVDQEAANRWFQTSPRRMTNKLFDIFRTRMLPQDPDIQYILDLMVSARQNGIYSFRKLMEQGTAFSDLPDHIKPESENEFLQKADELLIRPLSELGFIHIEQSKTDILWQWVPAMTEMTLPETEDKVYVQPDLEIAVPPNTDLAVEWQIASFSEVEVEDGITRYHLSKTAIRRAIEKGWDTESIKSFLSDHSLIPLQDSLINTIERWSEDINRFYYRDVRLLTCRNKQTADELSDTPVFQAFLERVGDLHFIVAADNWDRLLEEMGKRGYAAPRPLSEEEAQLQETKRYAHVSETIIRSGPSQQGFKVENVFPDLEDAFPGFHQIPKIWWKHFRRYHETTLRDLIQRGIQIQLPLQIEAKQHETPLVFNPERLVNEHGYWVLYGSGDAEPSQEMKVKLEDIERIKLVVPELFS
ncbi:MAG: helicase-associated domain-containing protein [Bacillaceae bacterium]|nr:helicase-associated domain-containing protein [Bacillaceae bacterium]